MTQAPELYPEKFIEVFCNAFEQDQFLHLTEEKYKEFVSNAYKVWSACQPVPLPVE